MSTRMMVVGLVVATLSCSDDGPRSFELGGRPYNPDQPLEATDLADDWAHVEVEIIQAPDVVTAGGDDFPLVLEIHNPLDRPIPLKPCPVWEAGMGESGEVSSVEGRLPCEEIGSLGADERIRLRMEMPPTEHAVVSEGLVDKVGLGWRLKGEYFQETSAHVAMNVDGPR